MWDTATEPIGLHLSHEMPCTACGHAPHSYLPCSETCDCVPPSVPGAEPTRAYASVSTRSSELALR